MPPWPLSICWVSGAGIEVQRGRRDFPGTGQLAPGFVPGRDRERACLGQGVSGLSAQGCPVAADGLVPLCGVLTSDAMYCNALADHCDVSFVRVQIVIILLQRWLFAACSSSESK